MTLVLEESEEVSPELLAPLLDSLRVGNQVLHYSSIFLHFVWIIYLLFALNDIFVISRMFCLLHGSWGRK